MFGRLVKYDFRSMFKQFGFIWPAALLLALVNHFTLFGLNSTSTVGETAAGMAMLVYVAILMAMFIITMIFVIQRFFKGLLGDEGYLMHTLPVRPWQLISIGTLSFGPCSGAWGTSSPTGTSMPPTASSSCWSSCCLSAWAWPRGISSCIWLWRSAICSAGIGWP